MHTTTRPSTLSPASCYEEIEVTFGDPDSDTVIISTTAPTTDPVTTGASIVAMQGETEIPNGGTIGAGTNAFFIANVPDGYHVSEWTVTDSTTRHIKISDETLSLYNIIADTTVTYTAVKDNYVVFDYGVNNDTMGTITAKCDDVSQPYVERPNAPAIYQKLNEFALDLMNMTTDGKKNVAIAIGPMNGDILFDGQHEWLMDTISGVLPSDFQKFLGTGITYDVLIALWNMKTIGGHDTYKMKETANYYLSYRMGFLSKPFTEEEGGKEYQYVKFMVVTKDEPMSALSVDTVKQVFDKKDAFIEANKAEDGTSGFAYEGYLSGAAVQNYEMSELVNKDFKFIIVVVIVLLILLLFFVMKSYLTPIRAVVTILMSVLWTLGLTYIIFDMLLGIPVVWVVPIVLFVVCLGLGMDYDILLTTRIRENVTKGMTNDEAIIAAVQRSGAIITLCGLIMAGAFGTMMVSTTPMLKEFGFALGFAIAVDALVIRTYVVPAVMHVMGDWNWKGPNYSAIKARIFRKKTEE
jgi:predicted RND superfamily exporter protein